MIKKTEQQIALIRDLYSKDISFKEISEITKCSISIIYRYTKDIYKKQKCGRKVGSIAWNKGQAFPQMVGNKHAFIGDKAKKGTGQMRAYTKFREIQPCVKCGTKYEDTFQMIRHHIDENTLNNSPENVVFMCRRCHMDHHRDKLTEYKKLKHYGSKRNTTKVRKS